MKRMDVKMELQLDSDLPVHYYGSNISAGSYVGKVMLGSLPKMLIIVSSIAANQYLALSPTDIHSGISRLPQADVTRPTGTAECCILHIYM